VKNRTLWIHWSTCNAEWRIEWLRYTDLQVQQNEVKKDVDTLCTGNTEWRIERLRYTDLHVTQSEG
jgi:hypothetical protein